MNFGDLKQGDRFIVIDEIDGEIFIKTWGHNLQILIGESMGGHAVNMTTGLLCFFHDHEEIEPIGKP